MPYKWRSTNTWVDDDLLDAYLFNIEMIPKWSEKWSKKFVPLLTIGQLDIPLAMKEKQTLVQCTALFVMLAGRMYHRGIDGVLQLCIEEGEKSMY